MLPLPLPPAPLAPCSSHVLEACVGKGCMCLSPAPLWLICLGFDYPPSHFCFVSLLSNGAKQIKENILVLNSLFDIVNVLLDGRPESNDTNKALCWIVLSLNFPFYFHF